MRFLFYREENPVVEGGDTCDCPSDHLKAQEQTPVLPVQTTPPTPPNLCWYEDVKPRNDEAAGAVLPDSNDGATEVIPSRC